MISDKVVEAAARAADPQLWAWADKQMAAFPADPRERIYEILDVQVSLNKARAALQAALPVLLEGKADEIARVIAGEFNATGWHSVCASPHFAGKQSADRLWPSWPDALVKTDRIISILTVESE